MADINVEDSNSIEDTRVTYIFTMSAVNFLELILMPRKKRSQVAHPKWVKPFYTPISTHYIHTKAADTDDVISLQ